MTFPRKCEMLEFVLGRMLTLTMGDLDRALNTMALSRVRVTGELRGARLPLKGPELLWKPSLRRLGAALKNFHYCVKGYILFDIH